MEDSDKSKQIAKPTWRNKNNTRRKITINNKVEIKLPRKEVKRQVENGEVRGMLNRGMFRRSGIWIMGFLERKKKENNCKKFTNEVSQEFPRTEGQESPDFKSLLCVWHNKLK